MSEKGRKEAMAIRSKWFALVLVTVLACAATVYGGENVYSSGIYTPPGECAQGYSAGWESPVTGFEGYSTASAEIEESGDANPQPVPEPGTLVLLLSGMSALAVRRRMAAK